VYEVRTERDLSQLPLGRALFLFIVPNRVGTVELTVDVTTAVAAWLLVTRFWKSFEVGK